MYLDDDHDDDHDDLWQHNYFSSLTVLQNDLGMKNHHYIWLLSLGYKRKEVHQCNRMNAMLDFANTFFILLVY